MQPIADRLINKLASWKGSLLSIAGRVELVKLTLFGMFTHSMIVYAWPLSLDADIERVVGRFIWSGDTSKLKTITVVWNNICKPTAEGVIGLRSLYSLNEAMNLKLALDILNSEDCWVVQIRERVMRKNNFINHHIFYSVWSRAKTEIHHARDNYSWCIGNGESTSLWFDS